jgi:hypothetical protein
VGTYESGCFEQCYMCLWFENCCDIKDDCICEHFSPTDKYNNNYIEKIIDNNRCDYREDF